MNKKERAKKIKALKNSHKKLTKRMELLETFIAQAYGDKALDQMLEDPRIYRRFEEDSESKIKIVHAVHGYNLRPRNGKFLVNQYLY